MSKRKILSLALTLCMVAILAVGGTLAYFTDTDSAINTMVLGNVSIEQNEYMKDGSAYVDKQDMLPMVLPTGESLVVEETDEDGNKIKWFNDKAENVVDKVITVKNTAEGGANKDAYVRTIIAFETATEYAAGTDTVRRSAAEIFDTYIGILTNGVTITDTVIEINGTQYIIGYKVYENALAAGDESTPSLKQLFMSPNANNEIEILFGDEYTVLALSQGVQTDGFANAATALNTAFGEITADNCATWFAPIAPEA